MHTQNHTGLGNNDFVSKCRMVLKQTSDANGFTMERIDIRPASDRSYGIAEEDELETLLPALVLEHDGEVITP